MKKPRRRSRRKPEPSEQIAWLVVGAGAAMIASSLMERSMKAGWRVVTSEDPPKKPESLDTGWKQAVTWTVLSAVALGLTQVFARRGAAIGWEKALGRQPPG